MNDPHVASLLYRVEHSPFLSYENAKPFASDLPEFRIRIDGHEATVVPREHYATAEEARAAVEPCLSAWELDAGLRLDDPEALRFVYRRACIVDRDPPPGTLHAARGEATGRATADAVGIRCLDQYPAPPKDLAVGSKPVLPMFDKWRRYKAGQASLPDAANFCRDELQKSAGGREAAADRYNISTGVLKTLGKLASEKGGPHARKSIGHDRPYTETEHAWLEAVLKKLIRRAAEVAHDPKANRPLITMGDLPPL